MTAANRNPSPPPEEDDFQAGDKIGDTAYSKRFVLSALLDLLKMSKEESDSSTEKVLVLELDRETEDTLCQLWDMSMDSEILIGVLANVASDSDNLAVLLENEHLPELCFSLLSCRDTPTLVETTRLLAYVVQMAKWTDEWCEQFESLAVWEDISFIVSSNTNTTLLSNLGVIIDGLMEHSKAKISEKLLSDPPKSWCCLLEAAKELLKSENLQPCSSYIHCFQSLSVSEEGAVALASHGKEVFSIGLSCVDSLCRNSAISTEIDLNMLCSAFLIFRSTITKENWNGVFGQNFNFMNSLLNAAEKLKHQKLSGNLPEDTVRCLSCLQLLCQDLSDIVASEDSNFTILSEISTLCT